VNHYRQVVAGLILRLLPPTGKVSPSDVFNFYDHWKVRYQVGPALRSVCSTRRDRLPSCTSQRRRYLHFGTVALTS
jgi:hypothetical protein